MTEKQTDALIRELGHVVHHLSRIDHHLASLSAAAWGTPRPPTPGPWYACKCGFIHDPVDPCPKRVIVAGSPASASADQHTFGPQPVAHIRAEEP